MRFTKMQGAGNDYVYVDGIHEVVENPSSLARAVSDRHFGIGSDGLVLILPGDGVHDFEMRMFNADGSEAEMCGNASRCVAKYVHDRGLTKRTDLLLKTGAGTIRTHLETEGGFTTRVRVDMGIPKLQPKEIPTVLPAHGMWLTRAEDGKPAVIGAPLDAGGPIFEVTCVNMGNPHCVTFVPDVINLDVEKWGPRFELHPAFPKKVNTEFAEILDRSHIRMRVWERGAGETMACGTGACATLVAAVMNGLTERETVLRLNGGDLLIHWDEKTDHVLMTGPAEFVFDGEWNH